MTHKVLSLKYRPQRFDELKGQGHVSRILTRALASDRVGHAYLLVGPRGVGKTTTARIFARALNCSGRAEDPGDREGAQKLREGDGVEPCGTCPSCVDIAAGSDLDVVEMDAASNNAVDDVRALREQVGYATVRSRYRIWIVDEVHMLSLPAFNAFLKTLEEPPPQVKFLFCTTEEHKLPDTFRSRCQRVEFRPISDDAMTERLRDLAEREGMQLEDGLAEAIAHAALGGLRDAESQLEQLIAAVGDTRILSLGDLESLSGRASGDLLAQLSAAVDARDAAAALDAIDACLAAGAKPGVLRDQWLDRLREQMLDAVRTAVGDRPPPRSYAKAAQAIEILLAKRIHLRAGAAGDLVLQVAAVELARLPDARDLDALMGALREAGGAGAPSDETDEEPATPAPSPSRPQRSPPSPAPTPTPTPQGEAAPVPAPRRPAAKRAEVLDTPRVIGAWGEIVARAAERNAALGDALAEAAVQAVRADTQRLALPDAATSARGTLMRREVQLAFGQIVRELLGAYLRIEIVEAPRQPSSRGVVDPDMRVHPSVQRVTEVTGGRLLNVERATPSSAEAQTNVTPPSEPEPGSVDSGGVDSRSRP